MKTCKNMKLEIWSEQHPNASQNKQQLGFTVNSGISMSASHPLSLTHPMGVMCYVQDTDVYDFTITT